jgi:hypothetical protein
MKQNKTQTGEDTGRMKSAEDSRDLQDSPRDEARLQPDEATLDLPDVKDIPGQEFIHPPAMGELADTTISSADEEGDGLFDEEENDTYSLENDKTKRGDDNDTAGIP